MGTHTHTHTQTHRDKMHTDIHIQTPKKDPHTHIHPLAPPTHTYTPYTTNTQRGTTHTHAGIPHTQIITIILLLTLTWYDSGISVLFNVATLLCSLQIFLQWLFCHLLQQLHITQSETNKVLQHMNCRATCIYIITQIYMSRCFTQRLV